MDFSTEIEFQKGTISTCKNNKKGNRAIKQIKINLKPAIHQTTSPNSV